MEIVILCSLSFPFIHFMSTGWELRRAEFTNKFTETDFRIYIEKFWPRWHADDEIANSAKQKTRKDTKTATTPQTGYCDFFLRKCYKSLNGRMWYFALFSLLFITTYILTALSISTAIRFGIDEYTTHYAALINHFPQESRLYRPEGPPIREIDFAFPLPPISLNLTSLAAIAGAYMYVAQELIQRCRTRTLTRADLAWCIVRLVIAAPLGLSVSQLGNQAISAFVAFSLGAFPTSTMLRLIRRASYKSLSLAEEKDNTDALLGLTGVTPDIAADLDGEGIRSIQQLADYDPVALAIRTGFSFDFILSLICQAQVWCFIGDTAKSLAPLGYGDARAIYELMNAKPDSLVDRYAEDAILTATRQINKSNSGVLMTPQVLKLVFHEIACNDYTQFLYHLAGPRNLDCRTP